MTRFEAIEVVLGLSVFSLGLSARIGWSDTCLLFGGLLIFGALAPHAWRLVVRGRKATE